MLRVADRAMPGVLGTIRRCMVEIRGRVTKDFRSQPGINVVKLSVLVL